MLLSIAVNLNENGRTGRLQETCAETTNLLKVKMPPPRGTEAKSRCHRQGPCCTPDPHARQRRGRLGRTTSQPPGGGSRQQAARGARACSPTTAPRSSELARSYPFEMKTAAPKSNKEGPSLSVHGSKSAGTSRLAGSGACGSTGLPHVCSRRSRQATSCEPLAPVKQGTYLEG